MPLPINIEDLLNKQRIESNRIEFKAGWNPDKIYHTICAFATDLENIGGGYILVGVEEENGIAKRPVKGLEESQIDRIMKEMVGYDAKISPSYLTKASREEIDGKTILVIWAPAGANRPYSVCESVVTKNKSVPKFYIRSKSSTIEAKGEILDQVRELANRIPFDERGNANISIDDISEFLVYEHLKNIGSKLVSDFRTKTLWQILDDMDLLTGSSENRLIKNVAAMMFAETPQKFFPISRVEIVHFPEGSIDNPDILIEIPHIEGPVPSIIKEALSYIRTNVIKQRIDKPKDSEKSIKTFNYPFQSIEEAVVNALYHRDYQEREPVEITIEPTHIQILSYAGPDRSISAQALQEARKLSARRYRNRRLGDFLKELHLTEGRATGIPTIQKHLVLNGNDRATLETDDDRTFFRIIIPCHPSFHTVKLNNGTVYEELTAEQLTCQISSEELRQVNDIINQCINIKKTLLNEVITETLRQVKYNSKYSKQKPKLVAAIIDTLSILSKNEESAGTINSLIKFNDVRGLKERILSILIKLDYLTLTIPDKPNSRNQGYRLTDKGRGLFLQ